jgi:hypothetical protein
MAVLTDPVQLIYRPDRLAETAEQGSAREAALGFLIGAGVPACMIFAIGGAGVAEPYASIGAYFRILLFGLVTVGPISAIFTVSPLFFLLWAMARSTTPRTAMLGRTLLFSPLPVFVPTLIWLFLEAVAQMSDTDFGLGEPIPGWMRSPIILTGSSDFVLLGIFLVWLAVVTIAVRRPKA